MGRKIKLIMVTDVNNNKFYDMSENGDGTFLAVWGRVEGSSQSKTYPMSKWDSIYREKTKKGYKDVTHLHAVDAVATGYNAIADPGIAGIIKSLSDASRQSFFANYSLSSAAVTPFMVAEAQGIIDRFSLRMRGDEVNGLLLDLYKTLPRKMKNVKDHLAPSGGLGPLPPGMIEEIVTREQDILDSLKSMVSIEPAKDGFEGTMLDRMGISMRPKDKKLEGMVAAMLGRELSGKYEDCWYVENAKTQGAFDACLASAKDKSEERLWHGSRNANWLSIMQAGLAIRPSNAIYTGSMFGDGIYFADKSMKSWGYTSARGSRWASGSSSFAVMAIYRVHLGNRYHITRWESKHGSLCKATLAKGGYDSTHAHKGANLHNDEFIIYGPDQCTIEALVRFRA